MKKFVFASLLATVASGFILAGGPVTAAAAETHGGCASFDQYGNIVSVVPNCTETMSMLGGAPQQIPMPNPCTGDPGLVTLYITHQVFHLNVNGAGDSGRPALRTAPPRSRRLTAALTTVAPGAHGSASR